MAANWGNGGAYSSDPSVRQLQIKLGELAALWRGSIGDQEREDAAIKAYYNTLEQLYATGWNDVLDWDSELPDELMPQKYRDLHLQRASRGKTNWSRANLHPSSLPTVQANEPLWKKAMWWIRRMFD